MIEKIQVLVGSDENCIVGLVATLTSVAVACNKTRQLKFNIMNLGLLEETKGKIVSFFQRYSQVEINFINCDVSIYEKIGARSFEGLNFATYARLQAADLLQCDKCIYIDSDILVTKDISELWDMNIDDYALCAVPDSSKGRGVVDVDKLSHDCPFEHTDDISTYKYYNAGFLVCNLKRWRENSLFEKSMNLINKYKTQITSHDQTILNFIFRGQILTLPKEWNYIPWWTRNMKELSNLHFTSKHKPWNLRLYLPEEKMWHALYNAKVKPYWDVKKEKEANKIFGFLYVLRHWLIPAFVPEIYWLLRRVLRDDTSLRRKDDLMQFRAMRSKLYFRRKDKEVQQIINTYCRHITK